MVTATILAYYRITLSCHMFSNSSRLSTHTCNRRHIGDHILHVMIQTQDLRFSKKESQHQEIKISFEISYKRKKRNRIRKRQKTLNCFNWKWNIWMLRTEDNQHSLMCWFFSLQIFHNTKHSILLPKWISFYFQEKLPCKIHCQCISNVTLFLEWVILFLNRVDHLKCINIYHGILVVQCALKSQLSVAR